MNLINQNLHVLLLVVLFGPIWFMPSSVEVLPVHHFLPPDTVLSCNDLVHVSLDEHCEALIEPDDILEGYNGNWNDVAVTIYDTLWAEVPNPVNGNWLGRILIAEVTHLPSGNTCIGEISIEDKFPPTITCDTLQIPCFQELDGQLYPEASDNCDSNPQVELVNFEVDNSNPCGVVTIRRTFVARDHWNNFSGQCVQLLTTFTPGLPSFPIDTTWECDIFEQYPNVIDPTPLTGILATTGSGRPDVANGQFCTFSTSHNDVILQGCQGLFSIVRTWTVMNWCTGEVFTNGASGEDNVQLIAVKDRTPPQIVLGQVEVGANISDGNGPCKAIAYLPPALVIDNCHNTIQRIFTPIGEADYLNGQNGNNGGLIPAPGLPLGEHILVYQATDACGNTDTIHVKLIVKDLTAPVAVCDEITSVSLSSDGYATLMAESVDDGSYDACCLDSFAIRKMNATCTPDDTVFSSSIQFCCVEAGEEIMVVFRAFDCSGNYNDCMVSVLVEDKQAPLQVHCPPMRSTTCDFFSDSLQIPLQEGQFEVLDSFGLPDLEDNCSIVMLSDTAWWDLDQCLKGVIWRRWEFTDNGHNDTLNCTLVLQVDHVSDWVVKFPADLTVDCQSNLPPTGEPEVFFETCELVAVSHSDAVFTVVPDACYKIVRHWKLINWCIVNTPVQNIVIESSEKTLGIDLDGDGQLSSRVFQDGLNSSNLNVAMPLRGAQPDGIIEWEQVIKVIDQTSPSMTCPPFLEYCIESNECTTTVQMPLMQVEDCSGNVQLSVAGQFGNGPGPYHDVGPGLYSMQYYAEDGCNNGTSCEVLVLVKDCKAPTPYCINGLSITLEQDTSVTVYAENFDAGSWDNCDGPLKFSFTPDVSATSMSFDCFDLGFVIVDIYVTDASGNQSFCETFVFVDDNQGVCQGPPLIAGKVQTELDKPVKDVVLNLNGPITNADTTGSAGIYSFQVEYGKDYTVSGRKNNFPLNGVTTFDIVLISKHILAIDTLDSPYKIIAADVNGSNTVTTADLVEIRKLILQISNSFPNNMPSWRLIPKNYVFPNPFNPFDPPFPEVYNFNDLSDAILDAHFVAIKLGDVNLSADPQK